MAVDSEAKLKNYQVSELNYFVTASAAPVVHCYLLCSPDSVMLPTVQPW